MEACHEEAIIERSWLKRLGWKGCGCKEVLVVRKTCVDLH